MKKIKDFGKKIGGARKDAYTAIREGRTGELSESVKHSISRDDVWPSIPKEEDEFVRTWKQKMRLLIPKHPCFRDGVSTDEILENYCRKTENFRNVVMKVKSEDDIRVFYFRLDDKEAYEFRAEYGISKYTVSNTQFKINKWKHQAENKACRSACPKSGQKKRFVPDFLENLNRTGENWFSGRKASEDFWTNTLKFKGVEFGNWLSQDDRRANMDMAAEAFLDLASVLGIEPASISFDGRLGIGFGSRGRGSALAHYEPNYEVINLTKLKGAGSLAHEWFHGLDDQIAKNSHIYGKLASQTHCSYAVDKLIDTMMYDENYRKTEFYKGSQLFDAIYSKSGNGYWASACEMAARAFACYVTDKLSEKGFRNDYLSGHSECCRTEDFAAIPQGDERKRINAAFDELFEDLKKTNILKAADAAEIKDVVSTSVNTESKKMKKTPSLMPEKDPEEEVSFVFEKNGQMSFLI